jgi:hypothetical protein
MEFCAARRSQFLDAGSAEEDDGRAAEGDRSQGETFLGHLAYCPRGMEVSPVGRCAIFVVNRSNANCRR